MLIKVELYTGEYVTVSQEGLNRLLERNLAKRFERRSGWAVVGVQPVRRAPSLNGYNCFERRRMVAEQVH